MGRSQALGAFGLTETESIETQNIMERFLKTFKGAVSRFRIEEYDRSSESNQAPRSS